MTAERGGEVFSSESNLPAWSKSVIILHRPYWQGQPGETPDKKP